MNIFDVSQGNVKYDNFNIDFTEPFEEQEENLLEDLFQIEFPNNYLIDLGWYPEYEINGKIVLTLIKNYDWENPIYKYVGVSENELKKSQVKIKKVDQENHEVKLKDVVFDVPM